MRTLGCFTLIGVLVVVLVALTARSLAAPATANAITAAATICMIAGLVAMVPPALVAPRHPDYLVQAGMGAIIIRLFLTLALGAAYLWRYAPPRTAFMTAIVICYLVLLAVETVVTARLATKHWRPKQS